MSISLLRALTDYYDLVDTAAVDPAIVVPPSSISCRDQATTLSR
jgi:hypothetical protein